MLKLKKPTDEIFHLNVDDLVKKVYPDYEGQHPLFEKFGHRYAGIYDDWIYTEDWEQLSDTEKWQYVALCSLYWKQWYMYWYERERTRCEIERMYRKLEEKKDNERERDFIEKYIQELEKSLTTTESVSE